MPNSIGIEIFVKEFLETAEHPDHRYFSQELCWKYFYSTKSSGCLIKNEKEHNLGSLHLAAYLASWGMYRGSSFLLREKNYLFYEPIVEYLYELDIKCWTIDANDYSDKVKCKLNEIYQRLDKFLAGENKKATDTRVTKVMLGVFGNVPAFDQYFKKAIGISGNDFVKKLDKVEGFYKEHKSELEKVKTYLQENYKKNYSFAKIIDMYGFQKGFSIGTVTKLMFMRADSNGGAEIFEDLIKNKLLKKVSLTRARLKQENGKFIKRPEEIAGEEFNRVWFDLNESKD